MKIAKDRTVSLHFTLADSAGEVLQTSREEGPLVYLHGHQNILPGLESRLEGLEPGAKAEFQVPAAEAFGAYDPEALMEVSLSNFPEGTQFEVGDQLEIETEKGTGDDPERSEPLTVTVVEIDGDSVTLDGNHPLAGTDLAVSVEILEVREATQEELAHGHPHGQGCCGEGCQGG